MTQDMVRLAICGVRGRMGNELATGLPKFPGISVVGGCDPRPATNDAELFPVARSLSELFDIVRPDVVVDFTVAESACANAECSLEARIPILIGTSGITETDLERIDQRARQAGVGALVAPNFAVGANLLLQFARVAAKFFDSAEVIEIHHDGKVDAPSGTAMMIARAMREARGHPFAADNVTQHNVEGARGAQFQDMHIHSLRMAGVVATHEVILGGPGQTLTLRHDSSGRESFLPGVAYAATHIQDKVGLIYGLDRLMDFS
ncbi:MAG: 4-hydroxy-tetrahydrodipicolinate reductase [Chloroflexi bacterium]|nr:4-hydroxy-tetrahydrodipicolinate reductase [Chloroflexota bacterium]